MSNFIDRSEHEDIEYTLSELSEHLSECLTALEKLIDLVPEECKEFQNLLIDMQGKLEDIDTGPLRKEFNDGPLEHYVYSGLYDMEVYEAFVDTFGIDYADEESCDESYRGEYKSAREWAYEMREETGESTEYFDADSFIHDCECDGYQFVNSGHGTVYVFSNF